MASEESLLKPMSFSPPVFAALTPVLYLLAHLKPQDSKAPPRRANGRSSQQFRQPLINTNSLTYCNGSAVVRIGDTACVCGVRAEILRYEDVPNPPRVDLSSPSNSDTSGDASKIADEVAEISSLHLLVPNVDLGTTGCLPSIPPGQAPSTLAQSLSQRLYSLLISTHLIPASDLRILYTRPKTVDEERDEPDVPPEIVIKAYWCLYIDIMFISADGNLFDAAWMATLTALRNTTLPRAWWNPDLEAVVCADSERPRRLALKGGPVAASFAVLEPGKMKGSKNEKETWVLADPDGFEEGLCRERVTVVVDQTDNGFKVRRIEKSGGTVLGKEEIGNIVKLAEMRWKEVRDAIDMVKEEPI